MKLPIHYPSTHFTVRKQARNEYVAIQDGKCWHCNSLIGKSPPKKIRDMKINKSLFPSGFFEYPIHLHHNHHSGMTIGAVHAACNAVLWQYYGE